MTLAFKPNAILFLQPTVLTIQKAFYVFINHESVI